MDDKYWVSKAAGEIVESLLSGDIYPVQIDKPTYDGIYSQLIVRYPNLRPRVFLFQGQAVVQFSGVSAATFIVIAEGRLTRERFTPNCVFRGDTERLKRWPKALISDVFLLKWYLIPICLFGICLLVLQSPNDLHSYFTLVAQVLAIVFTLYAVLRQSFKNIGEQDLPDFVLNMSYRGERVIGVTGIGSIVLCLLGFLVTSSSITIWDAKYGLALAGMHISLFRWMSVAIGVVLLILLASFFRSIIFYYPDLDYGQTLLRIRDAWFKQQHVTATKDFQGNNNEHKGSQ